MCNDSTATITNESHNIEYQGSDNTDIHSEVTTIRESPKPPPGMSDETYSSLLDRYYNTPGLSTEEREKIQKLLGMDEETIKSYEISAEFRAQCFKAASELNQRELRKLRRWERERKREEEDAEFVRAWEKWNRAK